jgi:hypothetical protein
MSQPGEEIIAGAGQRFRVIDVVAFDEEDESPFVGLLQVEAAYPVPRGLRVMREGGTIDSSLSFIRRCLSGVAAWSLAATRPKPRAG